jgi:hypothetical protein
MNIKLQSYFKYILALFLLVGLNGCFSIFGKAKMKVNSYRKDYEPVSHQARMLESTSTDTVFIETTGKGEDLESAIKDTKLVALWFVLEDTKIGLLNTKDARNKFASVGKKYYDTVDNYITFEGDPFGKKIEGDKTSIKKKYKINIERLKENLIEDKIIASMDQLTSALGQPTITVVPRDSKTKNFEFTGDVVKSYLTTKNFEVETFTKNNKNSVDAVVTKSLAFSGDVDPFYLMSLESGSDIFISVNPKVSSTIKHGQIFKKASVSLSAYYTASKSEIASATGHSSEIETSSPNAILQEATNDATSKLLSQILKKWNKEVKKGKYFRLILKTPFSGASDNIYNMLSQNCRVIDRKAGQTVFDYKIQCPNVKNSVELFSNIKNFYNGQGAVFREFDSKTFVIIKISNSNSDDIEIE